MQTLVLTVLLLLCATARSGYSWDQFPASPDILAKLISVAQKAGPPLASQIDPNDGRPTAYYMRSASYIGEFHAPFGRVHLLALKFIRSAPSGANTPPPRGHSFVAFFDETLCLRDWWTVDFDPSALSQGDSNSKLIFGSEVILDYEHLPASRMLSGEDRPSIHVIVDGQLFSVPVW